MSALAAGHPNRSTIPPRPAGESRPQWSVMIPTHDCAGYLRETLASVLAQDPGPEVMQISVVDDYSTQDDPRAVVTELGGGRVEFYRQPHNVGLSRNFDTCLQRACGHLVHVLHGDDGVRPGFYAALQHALEDHPEAGAAFCRYIGMDEHGNWLTIAPLEQLTAGLLPNWLEKIATGQRLQTPCMVVRRQVYERLGGFDHRLSYGEDWEMWVRIAASYPVAYVPEPLALYRVHSTSSTARGIRTGANGRDLRQAVDIIAAYLPPGRVAAVTQLARRNYAQACLRRGYRALGTAGAQAAVPYQVRDALRTDRSFRVLASALVLWLRWAVTMAGRWAATRTKGVNVDGRK
jgi:GT2 family glycosyltransferase